MKTLTATIFLLLFCQNAFCNPDLTQTQSLTCPLEAGYPSVPVIRSLTYNSVDLLYGGGPLYFLVLRYRQVGGNWRYKYRIPTSYGGYGSMTLTGLQPGTDYEWQVASLCTSSDTITSNYAVLQRFTTLPCTNQVMRLSQGTVTSNKASVSWGLGYSPPASVSFVVQYRAAVDTVWKQSEVLTGRTYSFTGLVNNTAYEWRVAEMCSPSMTSGFTDVASFTTTCQQPTGLRLANTIGITGAKLEWQGADVPYELQCKRVTGPQDSWTTVTGITATNYSLYAPNDAYEARLRAECESGIYSPYSVPVSFTMACYPPYTFSHYFLTSGYSVNTNNISSTSDGALGYRLQWRASGQSDWQQEPLSSRPYYIITGLTNNTTYEIRLQNQCSPTLRSEFTDVMSATTSCPAPFWPAFVQPYGELQWGGLASPVQVSYSVEWKKEEATDWQRSPVLNQLQPGMVRYRFPGLNAGTYQYRIQTLCADGSSSAYTPVGSFTYTPCLNEPVINNLNVGCVGAQGAVIQFTTCTDEQRPIEIRWRKKGDDCWAVASVPDSLLPKWVTDLSSSRSRAYPLNGLVPDTEYEWLLLIRHGDRAEPVFSTEIQSFTTRSGTPHTPTVLCTNDRTATVSWSPNTSPDATDAFCWQSMSRYQLMYRPEGSATWREPVSLSGTNTYTFGGLALSTTYEWRVRQQFTDSTFSAFSGSSVFRTTGCESPELSTGTLGGILDCENPLVIWAGCGIGQTTYRLRYRLAGKVVWTDSLLVQNQNKNEWIGYKLNHLLQKIPYEVQLQVTCADGTRSAYGNSVTVTAGCQEICRTPTDICHYDITENSAVLNWRGPGPYEFRWRKGGTADWRLLTVPAPLTGMATVFKLAGLEPNTAYDWQVRSTCSPQSDFTQTDFFRTVCYSPENGRVIALTPVSARVVWSETDPDLLYTIQWRKSGEPVWNRISGINSPSYSLTGLTPDTAYEWRVSTECSEMSRGAVLSFRTGIANRFPVNTITSVKDGLWSDPAVWSCQRIPSGNDAVQVMHKLVIQPGITGHAFKLTYSQNGRLIIQKKGRLVLSE